MKVRIELHSVTIRATIVNEENAALNQAYQATFAPEDAGQPGIIKDIFKAASQFVYMNTGNTMKPSPEEKSVG